MRHFLISGRILFACAGTLLLANTPVLAAPKAKKYAAVNVRHIKKNQYCVYKSKWVPSTKTAANLYLPLSGKKASSFLKAACAALAAPAAVSSISALPDASALMKSQTQSNSLAGLRAISLDQSGTPPKLKDIPDIGPADLFWSPGVISAIAEGSPSNDQCNQFFSSSQDGQSGGLGACNMAQGVGSAFSPILQSGTSLCYMKNFPSQANRDAGAIEIISGSLPNNDITKLFNPLSTRNKVIKVNIAQPVQGEAEEGEVGEGEEGSEGGPSTVFIKVFSQSANAASNDQYRVTLWFCQDGFPTGFDKIRLKTNGRYEAINAEDNGENFHNSTVTASLTTDSNGKIIFDGNAARRAVIYSSHGFGTFNGDIKITPNNLIEMKVNDSFGESSGHKGYSVSSFSGTDVQDLRFLEGAYKDIHNFEQGPSHENQGATEFRDTFYASAPGNSLLSLLDAVDINNDPFYEEVLEPEVDTSDLDCDLDPDIEVALDMSNATAQASVSDCEGQRLDNMSFCREDESVEVAQEQWFSACAQ